MSTTRSKRPPSGDDQVVGANIQKLRVVAGMTLSDLAIRVRISHQQLLKYEKGTNRACASMIYSISRTLNVPIHALFDGIGGIPELEALACELTTARKHCREIVDATCSLPKLNAMCRVISILVEQNADPEAK
jgi:transcriptional regulator with XRE-family HTH domain